MIEYIDKKLGKVKVLNVTEARANFATVLGDHEACYIITKNNKPLRVIVGYAEYEALKTGQAGGVQGENKTIAEEPQEAEFETRQGQEVPTPAQKAKKIESPVRGMLETNIALSQKIGPKKPAKRPEPKKEIPFFSMPKPEPTPEPTREEPVIFEEEIEAEDYFSQATEEELHIDDFPPPPETVDEPCIEETKAEPEIKTTLEQKKAEPVKKASPKEKRDDLTEEQREYFRKYKKLYESMMASADEALEENQKNQNQSKADEQTTTDIYLDDEAPEVDFESLKEQEAPQENQVEKIETELKFEPVEFIDEEIEEDVVTKLPANHEEETSEHKAQEHLPSLKDLLKELEDEGLSSEEQAETLDDREIDDLINRITQD